MKSSIKILLFLLPFASTGQDTTITISSGMFEPVFNTAFLADMDGWLFKKGNDTAWAKKNLNTIGWKRMKPSGLSEDMVDKNGRLECWFRIHFRLDTALKDTSLDLGMVTWGACDVYVDGKLLAKSGNTGTNGEPFKEHDWIGDPYVSFNVEKGNEHVLAIHFVDFLSPLPPFYLKSGGMVPYLIVLSKYGQREFADFFMRKNSYRKVWLSVSIVLCLLFWLLAIQNHNEKNVLLIAITSTIILLYTYCATSYYSTGSSYFWHRLSDLATLVFVPAGLISLAVLMLRIFKRKINVLSKILMSLIIVCGIPPIIYYNPMVGIFQVALAVFLYAYYIIVSWKTLKGAQWAIVTGALLSVIFGLLLAIHDSLILNPTESVDLLIRSGVCLSLPLSMLVYVAMRFKEIIHEVQAGSEKIVQLSEKEKQLAELQQQKTELEMQALRAQMNPHFIFNSLNSIDLFILQNDKANASKYLTKFSRLIRMILNSSDNSIVCLADDLDALKLYLELESLRFERKFSYKIECDPGIDADFIQVPPMLLQPFVENAIWHGLSNKKDEGHLQIHINQLDSTIICNITDDGIGRKRAAELENKLGKHRSMGMKITERRLAMMQKMNGPDKLVDIRDLVDAKGNAVGTEVILKIPLMRPPQQKV